MSFVMKTLALFSMIASLSIPSAFGQTQSEVEFLRARADAHERKISQLEKDLSRLKVILSEKSAATEVVKSEAAPESPAAPSVNAPINASVENNAKQYTVKPGDVLSRIATAHQSSVKAIREENKLPSDRIIVGQRLQIPAKVSKAPTSSSSKLAPPSAKKMTKHEVQSGETFYSIARLHNVSIHSLQEANPRVVPTKMYVGQLLNVGSHGKLETNAAVADRSGRTLNTTANIKTPNAEPSASTKKSVSRKSESIASVANSEPKVRTITVDHQITYGQFASRHGASTTQLNELNGLSLSGNTTLAKGSELYVPQF